MNQNCTLCLKLIILPLLLLLYSAMLCGRVIENNDLNRSINSNFKQVGVLPYFRVNGDFYIALYQAQGRTEYAELTGISKPNEKNIAQTASRIFFPLQQHRNIRTGSVDWPSPKYLETMIFQGAWARSYLMTVGNESYTYLVNVQRPSSLKKLRAYPMIIVRIKDLLESISPARAIDNYNDIFTIDDTGKYFPIGAGFARSLSRGDNWNFLKSLAFK